MQIQKVIIGKRWFVGALVISLMTVSGKGWTAGAEAPAERPLTGGYERPANHCDSPLDLNCLSFSCVAPQQVDFICLSDQPLPTRPSQTVERPTGPVSQTPAEGPAGRPIRPIPGSVRPSLPARPDRPLGDPLPTRCDCPNPQPMDSQGLCTDRLDLLPCLHHQQAAELSEKGFSIDTVDLPDGRIGYQIKATQYPPFVLPECPCEAPEMPPSPESQPTAPTPETPPATDAPPQVLEPERPPQMETVDQLYLCRTGMPFAVGVLSGREIPIASCPQLPAELAVEPFHVSLTHEFEKYLDDRKPEQLEAVHQKAETILKGWKERRPEYQTYPIAVAEIMTDETETAAKVTEPADLIDIDPEDVEIVDSSEEGRGPVIHVNVPAADPGSPEKRKGGEPEEGKSKGRGSRGGPDTAAISVASSNDVNNPAAEEVEDAGVRAAVIIPTEYLHIQGGGCSLIIGDLGHY